MHRLLERQLKKCFGRTADFPPEWDRLLQMVGEAYAEGDADRELLEHSMELSSRELFERNQLLAQAEVKYRSIFEHATEGIFQLAPDGHVISANPALASILGYDSPADLKESIAHFGRQVYVDPGRWDEMVKAMETSGALSQFESQARRKDGVVIWISETSRAVPVAGGNALSHFEGMVCDITRRRQSEIERAEMQKRLLTLSRQAGMADVASSVLHNVGNVLNSVNVSAGMVSEQLHKVPVDKLAQLVAMIQQQGGNLGQFLTQDERGRKVPAYLEMVVKVLQLQVTAAADEMQRLAHNIEHIKRVFNAQQDNARSSAVLEEVDLCALVDDALSVTVFPNEINDLEVRREFEKPALLTTDRHVVLQILINLLSNAKHALQASQSATRRITLRVARRGAAGAESLAVEVVDNGVGIPPANLTQIFNHGFTTKKRGHGFGLHASSNAAHQLGGALSAHSEGPGRGSAFVLELPIRPVPCGA